MMKRINVDTSIGIDRFTTRNIRMSSLKLCGGISVASIVAKFESLM